jgi:outer membrane protein TolC
MANESPLNAQQELVNARVALVTAQHDRVVASYTLLAAVGAKTRSAFPWFESYQAASASL